MKKTILFLVSLFLSFSYGQNNSIGNVGNTLAQSLLINPSLVPPATQSAEIFRFRPGLVTQLDDLNNQNFGFTNSRWFSLGSLNTGSQTVYGLRFQLPNKAVTFGYNNINNNNPRIEWIGTGANLGNLEFRVADSFGAPGAPAVTKLVTTMTSDGNTYFGDPSIVGISTKVGIENSSKFGLFIRSSGSTRESTGLTVEQFSGINFNLGAAITAEGGQISTQGILVKSKGRGEESKGVAAFAVDGAQLQYGVFGQVDNSAAFGAGIYGVSGRNGRRQWAGYFDGDVFASGTYIGSDRKLKDNIKPEARVLDKLSQLEPVTYDYKKMEEMNLSEGLQHGFISQELATVFPELTLDVKKPALDSEGKSKGMFEFKAINYNGMISILTAAVNELNTELKNVKEGLATLKNSGNNTSTTSKVMMEQNIPNPFTDQTIVRYQLSAGDSVADIMLL